MVIAMGKSKADELIRRYGELNGELHVVQIERGNSSNGLGLSLAGNKDLDEMSVFIVGITPSSPASDDGRVRIGDQLLEVNDKVLFGRSHLNASALIKGVRSNEVKIVLLRRQDALFRMAVKPIINNTFEYKEDPSTLIKFDRTKLFSQDSQLSSSKEDEDEDCSLHSADKENKLETESCKDISDAEAIELIKGSVGGLGFAIKEDTMDGVRGIRVRTITPGGVADLDGRLKIGDRILGVGDKSLENATYQEALDDLRGRPEGPVKLIVKSGKAPVCTQIESEKKAEGAVSVPNPVPAEPEIVLDPATCPIVKGKETTISIAKGQRGLGLSIVGGADTMLGVILIHEVHQDGAASKDGRLQVGDHILEVDDNNLRDATHEQATLVLRRTQNDVKMTVKREETSTTPKPEEDPYDVITVTLQKKPNKGLGLSIVGRRGHGGVFISDLVKGGVADGDGKLKAGDQIINVNGEDLRNASHEQAAALLKTIIGRVTLTVGRLKTNSSSQSSSRRGSSSSAKSGAGSRKASGTALLISSKSY